MRRKIILFRTCETVQIFWYDVGNMGVVRVQIHDFEEYHPVACHPDNVHNRDLDKW